MNPSRPPNPTNPAPVENDTVRCLPNQGTPIASSSVNFKEESAHKEAEALRAFVRVEVDFLVQRRSHHPRRASRSRLQNHCEKIDSKQRHLSTTACDRPTAGTFVGIQRRVFKKRDADSTVKVPQAERFRLIHHQAPGYRRGLSFEENCPNHPGCILHRPTAWYEKSSPRNV